MYFDNDSEKNGIFFRNSLNYELYCVISGIQASYPVGRLLSGRRIHPKLLFSLFIFIWLIKPTHQDRFTVHKVNCKAYGRCWKAKINWSPLLQFCESGRFNPGYSDSSCPLRNCENIKNSLYHFMYVTALTVAERNNWNLKIWWLTGTYAIMSGKG
jgi:hypothetical protein